MPLRFVYSEASQRAGSNLKLEFPKWNWDAGIPARKLAPCGTLAHYNYRILAARNYR
ncbi:MAG: hypothetical protein ACRD19_17065 [Terriglobia bacterium]